MKKAWTCVEIPCADPLADEIAAEVAVAFGVGVEITTGAVRFYLEGERIRKASADLLERLLRDFAESAGMDAPLTYQCRELADGDWADRWKEGFKPLRVGRHLVVSPTWEDFAAGPLDLVIRIDPGRAFGTGHHETTRLCLEWLEQWASSRRDLAACSLLDVGTGSGILAIGAALLGFARVVGVDTDPEAIEVAEENVRLNGLAGRVQLRVGTATGMERFDIVVANIQANPLVAMTGALKKGLKEQGRLVLSGILLEQREQVQTACEAEGLRVIEQMDAGEWCLLAFE